MSYFDLINKHNALPPFITSPTTGAQRANPDRRKIYCLLHGIEYKEDKPTKLSKKEKWMRKRAIEKAKKEDSQGIPYNQARLSNAVSIVAPPPNKKRISLNFQGFGRTKCEWRPEVQLTCYLPPKYGNKTMDVCQWCLLPPCIMVEKAEEIERKRRVVTTGAPSCTDGGLEEQKEHVYDQMKYIVLPGILGSVFSKRYAKNNSLPGCMRGYLSRLPRKGIE